MANPSPAPEVLAKLADWRVWADTCEPARAADIRSLCDLWEAALTALAAATREAETLRGFALFVLDRVREGYGFDGGDLQDEAVERGLLVPVIVAAPCDPECCTCAEVGDFPLTCYRNGPALAPRSPEGEERT